MKQKLQLIEFLGRTCQWLLCGIGTGPCLVKLAARPFIKDYPLFNTVAVAIVAHNHYFPF